MSGRWTYRLKLMEGAFKIANALIENKETTKE